MEEPQDLVWLAEVPDRYSDLKFIVGFGAFLAIFPVTTLLGWLADLDSIGPVPGLLFLTFFGAYVELCRRHLRKEARETIEVRLMPADLPTTIAVKRADGTETAYPAAALRGVEVQSRTESATEYRRLRLVFADGQEQTRKGRADDAARWAEALTVLEIRVGTLAAFGDDD